MNHESRLLSRSHSLNVNEWKFHSPIEWNSCKPLKKEWFCTLNSKFPLIKSENHSKKSELPLIWGVKRRTTRKRIVLRLTPQTSGNSLFLESFSLYMSGNLLFNVQNHSFLSGLQEFHSFGEWNFHSFTFREHTFAIIIILDLKIHQSMWIHWPFFPKTWTKGHWPLDDLWPHVCWGHMCDSTQGSLCPSPMTIHQCMWIQWSILQNTTYILHILHTYYVLRTYYVQNEWSHSLLLNSVQARQKLAQNRPIWLFLSQTHGVCASLHTPLDTAVMRDRGYETIKAWNTYPFTQVIVPWTCTHI